jgi:ATP-dependent RNA helicase HelY
MLQRSLAQYQTSQRIRIIERDIVEIEAELVGLTAGQTEELARADELFEEYQSFNRSVQALERQEKDLQVTIAALREESETSTPWTEPGRLALRKLLRVSKPGLVVHARQLGWSIFLGRSATGGIGSFLSQVDQKIHVLDEYRRIDQVDDAARVDLPEGLIDPTDESLATLNDGDNPDIAVALAALAALALPDLNAIATAHRELVREQADAEIAALAVDMNDVHEQIRQLEERKASHPFRDTKYRKQHQRSLRQRDALEKEKNTLADILAREIDAEDVRIRGIIRGIRDVLHRFGYLQRGYPTEKADMLADVFDNDGLILCEMIDQGLLDALSPDELAEVFSWFSFDREFRYTNGLTLPNRLIATRRRLEDLEHEIIGEERDLKLFISEGHNPSFYGPALHWCRGWTMAQIGEEIELSEGDLVITFNKTIDLMRQVRDMLMDVIPEHPLRNRLREAEKLIRRGIVEQSLTLGFAPIDEEAEGEAGDDPEEVEDIDTLDDEAAALD